MDVSVKQKQSSVRRRITSEMQRESISVYKDIIDSVNEIYTEMSDDHLTKGTGESYGRKLAKLKASHLRARRRKFPGSGS